MNGIGPIFKGPAIPFLSHSPPYVVWDDSPPFLLALAPSSSNPATQ